MKSYYIHLIRNGLTKGNVEGAYIGHIDEPLSEEGNEQIKQMIKDYDYPQVDLVMSSPLSRCTETAKLIYPDKNPVIIDGLIEYNFGEFEGKTAEQLQDEPLFPDWLAGKEGVAPPFGESNEEFAKRIAKSFIKIVDSMISEGLTKAAIVTHGGVIMAILSFFGIPQAPMHEWLTPGGCGYTVRITPYLWSQGKRIEVTAQIPKVPGEDDMSVDFFGDYSGEEI